jgi:3-methyladenine DNA glycosylase AlkD
MHVYLNSLHKKFKAASDAEKSEWMKGYMLHQFDFYGVQAVLRKEIGKTHHLQNQIKTAAELELIVKECFSLPQREFQYFAIQLFALHKKLWTVSSIKIMEYCLLQKSWWDSVDGIASDWLGPYFKMFPEQIVPITSKWNRSKNMWLQRSSIMFQKAFKKNTDTTASLQIYFTLRVFKRILYPESDRLGAARVWEDESCVGKEIRERKSTGAVECARGVEKFMIFFVSTR